MKYCYLVGKCQFESFHNKNGPTAKTCKAQDADDIWYVLYVYADT
jgi:hypothetical protein